MRTAALPSAAGVSVATEFEDLFRDHYQLVYRTAYSVTGSRQDAEDVLQTIFLRLLRRGLRPDLAKNPAGYLYRAAVNLSLNTLRARKRQRTIGGVERLLVPVSRDESSPDDETRQRLLDAIGQLRPRAVEILILHYEHGYSDAQIATLIGTSRGTIAVTLYRLRARLKKLLSHSASGGMK